MENVHCLKTQQITLQPPETRGLHTTELHNPAGNSIPHHLLYEELLMSTRRELRTLPQLGVNKAVPNTNQAVKHKNLLIH